MNNIRTTTQTKISSLDALEKLKRIELKLSKRKGFRQGFLAGFLSLYVLIGGTALIIYANNGKVLEKVIASFVTDFVEDIFKSFPDAYFSFNRERIIEVFDDFTNAAADNQISKDEFKEVARTIMAALHDKELTYQEIGEILTIMENSIEDDRY